MTDRIETYLAELRRAMRGSDPALVDDAVYDAAEFLRSAVAADPGTPGDEAAEAAVAAYGGPDEIAAAYEEMEATVSAALRTPVRRAPAGRVAWFFGVLWSPREWAALAYLLTAAATGFAYFFLTVGGAALTGALLVFVVGVPFALLYLGTTRAVSLVEGRIVETLLGMRMPRRPLLGPTEEGWLQRFKHWFTSRRTWTTLVYLAAQLPLGFAYLVVFGGGLLVSLWAVVGPFAQAIGDVPFVKDGTTEAFLPGAAMPFVVLAGLLAVPMLFRLAGLVGSWHARYAKWMLVGSLRFGASDDDGGDHLEGGVDGVAEAGVGPGTA